MYILQIVFVSFLNISLIKEMFILKLISLKGRQTLEVLIFIYFLILTFFMKKFNFFIIFLLFPLFFLLFLFLFLKKREEQDLLFKLYSLLLPLESQMRLGSSFINAWQKSLSELKSEKIKNKAQQITEILKFQKEFHYPDKEVENFIKDLITIHCSSSPLKKLKYLQRKVRIELAFQIKSKRLLIQNRLQSLVLSLFYFAVLFWTVGSYGQQYFQLIVISFFMFLTGLLWIFKIGRSMKWSV